MDDDEHVEPQDPSRRNSAKAGKVEEADSAGTEAGHEACYWNDKKYSDGATICEAHTRHKCWNGKWVEIGLC
ncbi:MAG TPA: hypothetical protein VHM92_05170 [Allosphingosinicella sp.]|nr:hypothetical protein [Allosphingosinicella sp.]